MAAQTHECGGSILGAIHAGSGYSYCDRCGAFAFDGSADPFPSGTDAEVNGAAWNDGELCSPQQSLGPSAKPFA